MCLGIAGGCIRKPENEKVMYICNRKRCEVCHPECQHTSDIRFAADFKIDESLYVQSVSVQINTKKQGRRTSLYLLPY